MTRTARAEPSVIADPLAAAKAAHLRYVTDDRPGFTRAKVPGGFAYYDTDGKEILDQAVLARIRALGLPPAYTDVWICPLANGHLQATGRDARGRKQYRYHARWREVRDAAKYDRMLAFGAALPKIRARVDADLRRRELTREKVIAAVVYLLEKTCIRVGNQEYAHDNESYGLTTLLAEHVDVHGKTLRFRFRGKSGKDHDIALHDARAARVIKKCQELPGHELFSYVDPAGTLHRIHSDDVNAWLHEVTGEHFTAKDFRTWAGTILCALVLAESEAATTQAKQKHVIMEAVKRVSQHLGNTPAICRKCYVHPAVIEAFQEGAVTLERVAGKVVAGRGWSAELSGVEAAVLRFLQGRVGK
jgi:DNA topoisomerase-1